MPSVLPEGDPAPPTGALSATTLAALREQPLGCYVHVPYCATRCGYCDFNTYTATELGGGASQATYADNAIREIELAGRVLGDDVPAMSTVFFGGGTPTLLAAADLTRVLAAVREVFGLTEDVEVTTEANPESVTPGSLTELRAAGFTRISFGMQSSVEHVLAALDRRHTPGRAVAAIAEARDAGFGHVNVDLIYGAPGESDADWKESLQVAVDSGADHVSAYSLIVEPGTRLAREVARGGTSVAGDDVMADRYLMAEDMLSSNGFDWYEVSNWATSDAARSRHNLLYWTGANWWGIGPGAHSHVGGVRWWNVKHPAEYARRLAVDASPAAARETLTREDRQAEDVMLRLRLREGLPLAVVSDGPASATRLRDDGLLDRAAFDDGRAVLTLRGRLLADAVVRDLLP